MSISCSNADVLAIGSVSATRDAIDDVEDDDEGETGHVFGLNSEL